MIFLVLFNFSLLFKCWFFSLLFFFFSEKNFDHYLYCCSYSYFGYHHSCFRSQRIALLFHQRRPFPFSSFHDIPISHCTGHPTPIPSPKPCFECGNEPNFHISLSQVKSYVMVKRVWKRTNRLPGRELCHVH